MAMDTLEDLKGTTVPGYLLAVSNFMAFLRRYPTIAQRADTMINDLATQTKGLKSRDRVETMRKNHRDAIFAPRFGKTFDKIRKVR